MMSLSYSLLVGAVLLASLASVSSQTIPNWSGNGTIIKVCASEYTPMVYCRDRDPEAYTGYQIELFRKAALILGWEPSMISWSCLDWEEMMDHLRTNDGVCDIAVPGIPASPENIEDGIVFTRPTYRNGLSIMVKNTQQTNSIWAFWDAFEWQLWVAAILTCVAVALIVWAIDNFYYRYNIEMFSKDPLHVATPDEIEKTAALDRDHKFERYFWEAVTRPMMNRDLSAFTLAGNIICVALGFLLLILFTLYLGNTAANLTSIRLETGSITGIDTLAGNSVGTWTDYVPELEKYNVGAAGFPWDSVEDEAAMIDALKTGAVKALVLDTALMEYISATDCEVSVVGTPFEPVDEGIAFPAGFADTAFVDKYNQVLISLQESGEDEQLLNTYAVPPPSECSDLYSSAVTFKQVAGLWVLLGIGIGAALAWLLIVKLWENSQNRWKRSPATGEKAVASVAANSGSPNGSNDGGKEGLSVKEETK